MSLSSIKYKTSEYESEIGRLKAQRDSIVGSMDKSPYTTSTDGDVSIKDISTQAMITKLDNQIDSLVSKKDTLRWYGDSSSESTKKENNSIVTSLLDRFSRPLYWGVGAFEHLTGLSDKKSQGIVAAMDYNAKTAKNLSGDVLRKVGVPGVVAAPLGFALDVAFDPVDMYVLGSTKVIPRTAVGAYKGFAEKGLKGAAEGAYTGLTSSLGKTLLKGERIATSMVPGMKAAKSSASDLLSRFKNLPKADAIKKIASEEARLGLKGPVYNWAKGITRAGDYVIDASKKFTKLSGLDELAELGRFGTRPLEKVLDRNVFDTSRGSTIGSRVTGFLDEKLGTKFSKIFKYSPSDYHKSTWAFEEFLGPSYLMDERVVKGAGNPLKPGTSSFGSVRTRFGIIKDLKGKVPDSVLSFWGEIMPKGTYMFLDLNPVSVAPGKIKMQLSRLIPGPDTPVDVIASMKKYVQDPKTGKLVEAGIIGAGDAINLMAIWGKKEPIAKQRLFEFLVKKSTLEASSLLDERAKVLLSMGREYDPVKHRSQMEELSRITSSLAVETENLYTLTNQKKRTGLKWFDDLADNFSKRLRSIKTSKQIQGNIFDTVEKAMLDELRSGKVSPIEAAANAYRENFIKKNKTVGQQVAGFYATMMSVFKYAKVPMSSTAVLNAYVGNAGMYHMMGGKLSNPGYLPSILDSLKFQFGWMDKKQIYDKIVFNKDYFEFFSRNPEAAKEAFGFSYDDLVRAVFAIDADQFAKRAGEALSAEDYNTFRSSVAKWQEDMSRIMGFKGKIYAPKIAGREETVNLLKSPSGTGAFLHLFPEAADTLRASKDVRKVLALDRNKLLDLLEMIEKRATGDKADPFYKALNLVTNDFAKLFQRSDTTYKLGTFMHMTKNGLDIEELKALARHVPIDIKKDILSTVDVAGETYYRLLPKKALELSQEAYMNYAAMPAFVKIVKDFPILGSPFIAFNYAMMQKFGKAIIHNPSGMNRALFAMREFSPEKSPSEKAALKSKYYEYFDSPGMYKLPQFAFFKQNPVYIDIAQMLPYLSFTFAEEAGRRYGDGYIDQVFAASEKMGFFQNPLAQLLKDYLVLPALLKQEIGTTILGQFGQPLYPIDATNTEKALYALIAFIDSMMPGTAAIALGVGTVGAKAVLPVGAVPTDIERYLPGYHARAISYAAEGKSSLGIQKKSASVIRALSSSLGIKFHPLDLTYLSKEVKEELKKYQKY